MLLYRMGKIPDSLKTLTNAYNLSEDLNIAIHLGELLWISGKHQQATSVWKIAKNQGPQACLGALSHMSQLVSPFLIIPKQNFGFRKLAEDYREWRTWRLLSR